MSGLLQHGGLMSQGAYQDMGEGLLSGKFSQPQGQGLLGALRGIGDPLYSALGVPPPPRWEDDPETQEMAQGIRSADLDTIGGMIGPGALMGMARPTIPAARRGWKVIQTQEPHPFTGQRDVQVIDEKGRVVSRRYGTRLDDDALIAEFGEPPKKTRRPTSRPKPLNEIREEPEGVAPDVAWGAQDLQDSTAPTAKTIMKEYGRGHGAVKRGYVDIESLPKARLAGGKSGYDWSELERQGSPPPAKLRINRNWSISILDGNHRIEYWREKGFDEVPAWIIDERTK